MNWQDEKKKIRRFLRDPDGNIWTDAFLLRCYNDEQRDLQHKTGILENIEAIRVPPMYQMSYMYDWEWKYRDSDGKNYQCLRYHHQSNIVCCNEWEAQAHAGLQTGESEQGTAFTHPWEAWYCSGSPNKPVPIWFPPDFYRTKFIAWDNKPIGYMNMKSIMSDNTSWQTESGEPFAYYRYDELSNEFGLYPRPSAPVFDDVIGDAIDGMVTLVDDDTVSQEYGVITDITGFLSNGDFGLTIDVVESDDNVLLIYDAMPEDIGDIEDESQFPVYMRKYIEYGVLEQAYSANTDGRIESLRDYWSARKKLGFEALRRFKRKRKTDRDYRLKTQDTTGWRTRREPKLPDTYPATTIRY